MCSRKNLVCQCVNPNLNQVYHKMPELPEVETTRRGIATHIKGQIIKTVIVREQRLRWEVPKNLSKILTGQQVQQI